MVSKELHNTPYGTASEPSEKAKVSAKVATPSLFPGRHTLTGCALKVLPSATSLYLAVLARLTGGSR